jgi:uncharacterized protein
VQYQIAVVFQRKPVERNEGIEGAVDCVMTQHATPSQPRHRALITGASSGIGEAMAVQLAAQGFDLVITARREDVLQKLAKKLRESSVAVDVVAADLSKPGAALEVWQGARANGPVDFLINNAGFGYMRSFTNADATPERDFEMIQLNVVALVELCKHFVNDKTANVATRRILNVASIAAYQAVPNMAIYASSKAMVRNFSEALHDEMKTSGQNISVTCVCPGGTKTAFHAAAGAGDYGRIANASMMSAEQVAQIGLKAMHKGKRLIVPGVANKLSCFGIRFVPRSIASRLAAWVMGKPRTAALPPRS